MTVEVVAEAQEVIGTEEIVGTELDEMVSAGLEDVVAVFDWNKHEHALDNLEDEDEHADAKVGIDGAGATVYDWQKAEALLKLPSNSLKQLSALQPAVTI